MPGVHMLNTQRFIQGLRGTLNSSNASCSSLPIFPPRAIYAESVSPHKNLTILGMENIPCFPLVVHCHL